MIKVALSRANVAGPPNKKLNSHVLTVMRLRY